MHADVRVFPTEDWLGASHKSARKVLPACQPKMADDSTSSAGERFNTAKVPAAGVYLWDGEWAFPHLKAFWGK